MSIIDIIKSDRFEARKNKDLIKTPLLTVLLSDILRVGKDSGNRETLEEEAFSVIRKYIKALDENLKLPLISPDQIFQYTQERAILIQYLPTQASLEELREVLDQNQGKTKGEIFKILKEKFGNNFDAKLVHTLL